MFLGHWNFRIIILSFVQFQLFLLCTIIFADINSAPTITNLPLASSVPVPENSPLGLSVFQVSYTDIDSTDAHVFQATYSPSSGGSILTINSTSTAT